VGQVGACQGHVVGNGSCRNQNVSNTNRRPSPQERAGYLAADPRGLVVECKHLCVLRPCEKLRCAIDLLRLMPSAHYFEHRHRRRPELGTLHRVVRENLRTLYAAAEDGFAGAALPPFVRQELESYLDCGLLSRGFAALECEDCPPDG
jgi:hypothetical protein